MKSLREQAMEIFNMEGNVFDIRHFSIHDGDGIRTTVFLKGCPLSCVWCHNPEGISIKRRALHFKKSCIGCGTCVALCENGGMRFEDGTIILEHTAKEDWEKLIYACPTGAIAMDSKVRSVEEVMAEILKDKIFYQHGGGMTLSGGEPLVQWQFACEILKKCQEEGIHTAIETALYVKKEVVEAVFPHLDMIFADLKIMDDEKHRTYIGVSNERIKGNIKLLLTSDKKESVIIRTPMIPGMTSTKENIQAIASYISEIYPEVSYEILNYNPLAESKYPLIGKEYCFEENPKMYTKEEMQTFGDWARQAGVKNIIIES